LKLKERAGNELMNSPENVELFFFVSYLYEMIYIHRKKHRPYKSTGLINAQIF
jgi:hypothetical protein